MVVAWKSALEVFRGGAGGSHPMTQRLAQPGLADCAEINAAGQMPALARGAVTQPEDAQINDVLVDEGDPGELAVSGAGSALQVLQCADGRLMRLGKPGRVGGVQKGVGRGEVADHAADPVRFQGTYPLVHLLHGVEHFPAQYVGQ